MRCSSRNDLYHPPSSTWDTTFSICILFDAAHVEPQGCPGECNLAVPCRDDLLRDNTDLFFWKVARPDCASWEPPRWLGSRRGAGYLSNPPTYLFNPNLFFQPSKTLFQPWVGKNVTPTKSTHGPYIPTFFFHFSCILVFWVCTVLEDLCWLFSWRLKIRCTKS